jgi:DNA-binding transcriptional MerR regulator/predicted O-methyltransferase YrrM
MYRTQLAESAGLSRATLLYYEKLGLLKARRAENGYRLYSEADRQRLQLLQRLQAGGLSLKECRACLDGKIDRSLLQRRLDALEAEIEAKQRSCELLNSLLGHDSLKEWHQETERLAPDLHREWLRTQGFSSEDAVRIALLSRDMNDHDAYMSAFGEVFAELEYWGPGSPQSTKRALAALPFVPEHILEIGCGNGVATLLLASLTKAGITATDTDQGALERLRKRIALEGCTDRVEAHCLDMADLPAPVCPYDVIWAEGSAYIIGVERAFRSWRPLLRRGGALVFSDMVWRSARPDDALKAFWASEYPAMTTVTQRVQQAERAGYRLLHHFDMGAEALDTYYRPLEARVNSLQERLSGHRVLDDLRKELNSWHECDGQFGYEMFILQKN